MRKVREVLRLLWDKQQSHRAVASACRIARSSVGEYERRAREAGLSWPLPAHLDDEALEVLLYPPSSTLPLELRPEPNYALIDRQLAKPEEHTSELQSRSHRVCRRRLDNRKHIHKRED